MNLVGKEQSDKGFTLTDLLVAATVTSVVVALSGSSVASMLDASNTANAKSERRMEINRSLNFISSEIQTASSIDPTGSSKTNAEISSNFNPPSSQIDEDSVNKALVLTVPGLADPIVYYSATPKTGKWSGPQVVYRWGPTFNANGTYDSTDSSTWKHQALIDKVGGSTVTPTCSDGTLSGNAAFYACVDPNGKTAEVSQLGQIKKLMGQPEIYGMSISTGIQGTKVASQVSNISGGASVAVLPTPVASSSSSPSPSPSPSSSPSTPPVAPVLPPAFTSSSGVVTMASTSTMTVRNLGGAITCGPGGANIPVSGTININVTTTTTTTNRRGRSTTSTTTTPITGAPRALGAIGQDVTFNNVPAGARLDITGIAGNGSVCSRFSFSANSATSQGSQVLTLVDGDTVPLFTPFGGQRPIDSFMSSTSTNPLTGLPLIDTTTGKVALAKNQVIYLFELGTTSKSSTAYDMQDLVVLATITPTTTTTTAYTNSSSSNKCNNGVGNGSDGCTPGGSTSKDEKLYNIATGALVCTPAVGNPCKETSTTVPAYKLPTGVVPKG